MQRGTSLNATPHSVASRGEPASSRAIGGARPRGDLESPGDSSPPGIQFTRGSFSDHLLPLDSPSPRRDDVPGRAPTANTPMPSLLRSPTRKRPPPPPSAAPRPPTSIPKRGSATTSSILMPARTTLAPPKAPWLPPSPTGRGRKESGAVTRAPAPTSPAPQSNPVTAIDLSVNPVDALVKKLRQQASELTQVYEQMESKDAELNNLRGEIKQLRMQAEMQRSRQRITSISSAPRSAAKKPTAAASSRQVSPASGVSRATSVQKHHRAVPPTPEKPQSDEAAIAMRRMEEAMAELRECHHELLGYCSSATVGKDALTSSDVQHELQLYIRVLEEAVHLKASELCITGHEELLVVLAELRHTIYQQEQEVGELQQQLTKMKSEHLECATVRLEIEDKTQKESAKRDQECIAMRQRETALQRQLEDAQRLAHTEHMRFREERAAQDEHAKRVASLEKELRARTHELREWETTKSDNWATKESRLLRQTEELKTSLDMERSEATRTKEALDKSIRQVDELKAMQEGLLQSIDQFVTKEDQFERQIKKLEVEAACARELRRESETLQASSATLHQELDEIRIVCTEQVERLRTLELMEQTNVVLKDAVCAKVTLHTKSSSNKQESADQFSIIHAWIESLNEILPAVSSSLPWLSTLVEELASSSSQIRRSLEDCKGECVQLRQSKEVFEQTFENGANELKRLQAELLEAQTELIQAQIETQKLQLRVASMEEEAREAQAQLHLRESLAEQIFEQENLLKTQQQRLYNALEQNHELMALETHLAAQLTAKENEISHLRGRLLESDHQQLMLRELEHELEEAASLAEQQNTWNQQLTVEMEHLELTKAEQDQLVETLETREEAFSSRFTTLFSQYIQFVAANKQRLKDEYAVGAFQDNQGKLAPASIHEEALGSGDVLQMLRVFPTLIEEYLASVMLGIQEGRAGDQAKRGKQRGHVRDRVLRVTNAVSDSDKKPQLKSAGAVMSSLPDDDEPLGAQLRLIARAFNQFKSA